MIRSMFASQFKNKLSKWWNEKSDKIKAEFDQKEKELFSSYNEKFISLSKELADRIEKLEKERRDLSDLGLRIDDRRKELEKVNDELKTQIRLIEAKASPDHVWESAFSQGFSKAWDMMVPLMKQGVEKTKEKIRQEEIENSFPRIDMIVDQKIKQIGEISLVEKHMVDQKKKEFESKRMNSQNEDEKKKLTNYISVLDWVMDGKNGN